MISPTRNEVVILQSQPVSGNFFACQILFVKTLPREMQAITKQSIPANDRERFFVKEIVSILVSFERKPPQLFNDEPYI